MAQRRSIDAGSNGEVDGAGSGVAGRAHGLARRAPREREEGYHSEVRSSWAGAVERVGLRPCCHV